MGAIFFIGAPFIHFAAFFSNISRIVRDKVSEAHIRGICDKEKKDWISSKTMAKLLSVSNGEKSFKFGDLLSFFSVDFFFLYFWSTKQVLKKLIRQFFFLFQEISHLRMNQVQTNPTPISKSINVHNKWTCISWFHRQKCIVQCAVCSVSSRRQTSNESPSNH